MVKKIAGKTFLSPGDEGAPPPLSAEEIEAANRMADEFRAKSLAVPDSERIHLPERFHDDLNGTEFEGWTPDDDKRK
ncbi:hypothetical protein ACQP1G_00845 [Nocardia sp. CA-107356]|uniref:hypothetical protein n=1 Tax=Nocardia sp. CA-107356 TaxID=3239972 RepID=UPI003D92AFF9